MNIALAVLGVVVVILLTLGTGIAVAAEFSLTALERSTVDTNVREIGDRRATTVQAAHRTLAFQLSGAQVAITLTTLATGIVAQPLLGSLLVPVVLSMGVSDCTDAGIALVAAL